MPAPKDTEDLLSKVNVLEKEEGAKLVEFVNELSAKIDVLQAEVHFNSLKYHFLFGYVSSIC